MKKQEGFTVVEVFVTLVIAAVLLMGAYQGYGLVISSSADSRNLAEASSISYESLRRNMGTAPAPCVASSFSDSSRIPASSTLPKPRSMTVAISCPYGTSSRVSRVTVTLSYGSSGDQVVHADYARN